jgi:CHRD domain-containing protein
MLMKRLIVLVGLVVLAGAALTTASARTDAKKTTICHRTASKKTPYVKVKVTGKALKAHGAHAADLIPAPKGGCPRTVLSPTSGGTAFQIALTGEAEGTTGDPVATGTATVRLRAGQAQVCYLVAAEHLPAAAAAHIHQGAAGTSGNVVVPLKTPGADGKASGCTNTTRPIVRAILASPAGFYVNVHTAASPNGAIRGQLTGTSTTSFGWVVAIALKGSTEPDATGTAVVRIRKDVNMVCYRLHAEKITLPATNAHIHRGGPTVSGPVVVPFTPPDANGNASGCTQSTQALVDEIIANPANFYVNVHTKEHPGGAMRQQLG